MLRVCIRIDSVSDSNGYLQRMILWRNFFFKFLFYDFNTNPSFPTCLWVADLWLLLYGDVSVIRLRRPGPEVIKHYSAKLEISCS